jgi:hypothetical protein
MVTQFAEIDFCESNPCQNGGTCISRHFPFYADFSCTCVHPYIGARCEGKNRKAKAKLPRK